MLILTIDIVSDTVFECLKYHLDYLNILTMVVIPEFELQEAENLIRKHHHLFIKLYCSSAELKAKTFISS